MSNWVPMNSTCWHEAYRLFKVFSEKIFHVFVVPDVFHWRNTFHTIVGVQQLGQIKDFYITVFLSIKTKYYFSADCSHCHNILRLFDVLPNFPFTTSETMRDYYLQTWYLQVT